MIHGFCCAACSNDFSLQPFERRTDSNGTVFDLWICGHCHAVLNADGLRDVARGGAFLDTQADSSDEFYRVDQDFLDKVEDHIDACGFVDFVLQICPDVRRGTFLDFGAGRGILAGRAARDFHRVYAAEIALGTLQQVHAAMADKDRITITDDYLGIDDKFDVITSTHVFEHLPDLHAIFRELTARLRPGGVLMFQVPMLRGEYLVSVHFTFMNEATCRFLAARHGLELTGVWYDHTVDFLNCIMRKPDA